ncbi:hypothetical protein LTR60_001703 [Cryomyces antarcticus]|nr:hypothetical protein LTR60_001703 [Cryomyces antarcticus]
MAGPATPGRVNLQQYEILRENTIAVTHPDRILKHSQARRRLDYQQLVRCYIYQLEHGCGTSSCTAPTCWTYRQRVATKPLRKYTSVSARVVAHTLSSAEDAQSGLCQFAVAASGIHGREQPIRDVVQPEQTKVDSKSLVQNLFNTIPLRTVEPTSFALSAGFEEGSNVESLSHLTGEIMSALRQFYLANHPRQPDARLCQGADLLKSKVSEYVDQSLFYTLSDAPTIVKSFRETSSWDDKSAPLSHIDSLKVGEAFKAWPSINGSLVFDSLWQGLEALFTPPPEIASTDHFHATQATQPPYINDTDAAHIATICIHAITASVRTASSSAWHEVCRHHRRLGSESQDEEAERRPYTHTTSSLAIIDDLEYEPARRLVDRLVCAISARVCFYEISKTRGDFTDSPGQPDPPSVMDSILQHLRHAYRHWVGTGRQETTLSELGWPTCFKFLQQLRTTFLDDWDGEAELNRWGAAGSAVQIMAYLYEHHEDLGLPVESLQFRGLGDELDRLHNRDLILKKWFERSPDRNTLNLLSYPFLFAPKYLILCSRIINSMFMNYAIRTSTILRRQHEDYVRQQRVRNVRDHLAARLYHSMYEHLVVNIRREHILEDAFYALWHRERRELFLPLRVRMGMNEGEIGHDLGGVQTEFFRLAFIEALKPETGE